MGKKQRNLTVDLAKGCAIILMVMGHCYSEENVVLCLVYAFHMPFFFLISGMLYAEKWKERVNFHLCNTVRRMLVPYAFFEVLYCLFIIVLGCSGDIIGDFFRAIVGQVLSLRGATVTWYLPCQLMVLCTFVLATRYLKKALCGVIFTTLFLVALLVTPPFGLLPLWRSWIGVGFFAVGFYGKDFLSQKCRLPCLIFIGVFYFCLVRLNGMVSLVNLEYSNVILYTINGLSGSYLLYQICMRIPQNKWSLCVEYFGKNSVIILCIHMFFVEIIRLLDYKLFDNLLKTLEIFEGVVFGGAVVLLMLPVIGLCNRYFGKIFGR